jgi:hypothetical protein
LILVAQLGLGEFFFIVGTNTRLPVTVSEGRKVQRKIIRCLSQYVCLCARCAQPTHQSETALVAHYKIAHSAMQHDRPNEQVFSPGQMLPIQAESLAYAPAGHHAGAASYDDTAPLLQPTVDFTSASVTPSSDPSSTKPSTRLQCPVCDKTFGRKGDLDRHSRKHFDGPRFYCQVADCEFGIRGFDRLDKHDDHMRRGHKMVKVDGVWIWKEWATYVDGGHIMGGKCMGDRPG